MNRAAGSLAVLGALLTLPLAAQDAPGGGLTFEAAYTGDVVGTAAGGVRRDVVYLDNLDLQLQLDGHRLLGWPGALAVVHVLSNRGEHPESIVGDAQGVSNIAAPNAWRVYEAWLQQNLIDGRLSLLAGLYDLNSEFDVIQSAGLFLNSSFGIGAEYGSSCHNGPSIFPVTSLGFRLKWRPRPSFHLEGIVADGVAGDTANPAATRISLGGGDGALLAMEAALFSGVHLEPPTDHVEAYHRSRHVGRGAPAMSYDAKLALGGWAYTGQFEDLAAVPGPGGPRRVTGSYGAYLLAERVVRRGPGGGQALTLFGRVGVARGQVNRFAGYLGGGAVYAGPFSRRPDDEVGLALAAALNSTAYRDGTAAQGPRPDAAETAVELTYRAQVRSWLALQPDIQYVVNPGTVRGRPNAWMLGLRGEVAFSWQP
jgi:porin